MRIGEMITRSALQFGDAPCVTDGKRTLSFRDFDRATRKLGNALLARGYAPGDRIAVALPNSIECLVTYYALAKAGLIRVQLNIRENLDDHLHKISESGARAIIHGDIDSITAPDVIGLAELDEMMQTGEDRVCRVEGSLDDPLRFAFTGGTTGKAKAVVLTHRCELMELVALMNDLLPGMREGDRFLHAAPISHASGAFFLPAICRGAHSIMMRKFEPREFLKLASETGATMTFLVPTMLAMIVEEPKVDGQEPDFQRIVYGASPISPSLVKRSEERFGKVLAQTYGQSENPMAITCLQPSEHDRVGSCGRPYTMMDVAIFDENDRRLPAREIGEIVCRGVQLMAGYWNRPEATADAIRDGWLRTGDMGYCDEEGYFYIVDRRSDMFISGGFNVYPNEVEAILMDVPGVIEAAVVGLPDPKWGEIAAAAVTCRPGVTEADIMDHIRDRLSGYKRPKRLEIWPALPKTGANKIRRREVREKMLCDALAE